MGDEIPGMEAGDINFIIKIKDHPVFKRQGSDLLVQKELSLNQALCGFAVSIYFNLKHRHFSEFAYEWDKISKSSPFILFLYSLI